MSGSAPKGAPALSTSIKRTTRAMTRTVSRSSAPGPEPISLPLRRCRLRMPSWTTRRPTTRSHPTASTSPIRRSGVGPPDLVWQPDWPGNIDFEWEPLDGVSFLRELASFSRVITHDQRGIGLSSRNVAAPRSRNPGGGSASRARCRRRRSGRPLRDLQLRRRQRLVRGDRPGAGAVTGVDRAGGAHDANDPTIPGARPMSIASTELAVLDAVGHLSIRLGPHRARDCFGSEPAPDEMAEMTVEAKSQRMHARCRQADERDLVRHRCAGGAAGGQMSNAPAVSGRG